MVLTLTKKQKNDELTFLCVAAAVDSVDVIQLLKPVKRAIHVFVTGKWFVVSVAVAMLLWTDREKV